MIRHTPHLPFYAIALTYFVLALAYGIFTPIFEAPDEQHHYFTVETIATTWQLPFVGQEADGWMRQEAAQPPLYYLFGALFIAPLSLDGAESRATVQFNPFTEAGQGDAVSNLNAFVHGEGEQFPWQGRALAVHLLRMGSALMGLGSLWAIYASARLVWGQPAGRDWFAVGLVAFLPQFAFIHGVVSNDPLITLLATLSLWQMLRVWRGYTTQWEFLRLGVLIGLAMLTKNQGVLLLAAGCWLLVAHSPIPNVSRQQIVTRFIGYTVVPALLLTFWLYLRNWQLYGDPTATNQFIRLAGGDRHYTLWEWRHEIPMLWESLFARFGWMNVRPPDVVYLFWNGLVLLAGGLLLVAGIGTSTKIPNLTVLIQSPVSLLLLWVCLVLASLVQFNLQTPAHQGRLLFPVLLPIALGLASGLWRSVATSAAFLGGALLTSVVGLGTVVEAYKMPALLTPADIPTQASRLEQKMGQGLTLIAAEMGQLSATPGEVVEMTLYWQAAQIPTQPPVVQVELIGQSYEKVGEIIAYHGRGLYPATQWTVGTVVTERIAVRLSPTMETPTRVQPFVRLVGEQNGSTVGEFKVVSATRGQPTVPNGKKEQVQIGGKVMLVSAWLESATVPAGSSVTVHLLWRVTQPVGEDWTTFVHLLDENSQLIAQRDAPPRQGDYPTRFWETGEWIEDTYELVVPAQTRAGSYLLWVGMYHSATIVRQPLFIDSIRQPNDSYPVGVLKIE